MDMLIMGRYSLRFTRWVAVIVLLAGVVAGLALPRLAAQAQDMESEAFTAFAGSSTLYNTDVLAFAPQSLQVHRGDTVTWVVGGFHNIRFGQGTLDLMVPTELNGQQLLQLNPAVGFPTVASGDAFQGGEANSGIPLDPAAASATFSLVMDAEPGVYTYYCDVHPGMTGSVEVVEDSVAIPTPAEVLTAGANQMMASGGQGVGAAVGAAMVPAQVTDGVLQVQAGLQAESAAVLAFFPATAVIHAGESVTWAVPLGLEPHTVTSPALPPGSEIQVIPQEGGPPIIALSEVAAPTGQSGSTVASGAGFNSGFLFPGESFTLTFEAPGVYDYVCILHAGMNGSVVVLPPA